MVLALGTLLDRGCLDGGVFFYSVVALECHAEDTEQKQIKTGQKAFQCEAAAFDDFSSGQHVPVAEHGRRGEPFNSSEIME